MRWVVQYLVGIPSRPDQLGAEVSDDSVAAGGRRGINS
jgi:hypothetical protein